MSEDLTSADNNAQTGVGRQILLGAQMLFVAFGALVLVPILTGLDPSVALFTAGAGTLVFQLVTKRQVPVFLASSFAFIAPIIFGVKTWGIAATMSGLIAAGLVYVALSFLVRFQGQKIIDRILPPVVVGPVIMVIGLSLAPVAVNMAQGKSGDGAAQLFPLHQSVIVALIAIVVTMLVTLKGRGMFRLLPILCGILSGYAASFAFGLVNLEAVSAAPVFAVPSFTFPEFNLEAILFILPVAIAPAIEHIGDVAAISNVTKKDYLQETGLTPHAIGRRFGNQSCCFSWWSAKHHLFGSHGRCRSDQGVQSGDHDLCSGLGDCSLLLRHARCGLGDHSCACHGRYSDHSLRCHCRGWCVYLAACG